MQVFQFGDQYISVPSLKGTSQDHTRDLIKIGADPSGWGETRNIATISRESGDLLTVSCKGQVWNGFSLESAAKFCAYTLGLSNERVVKWF